jgi:condensation domain-containing protein
VDGVQVMVSFDGPAVPPAPLTWGQRALWKAYRQRGRQQMNNLRRILVMPPQAPDDVDSVLRALATLVGSYSSLRTRLHLTDGDPRQVVAASGELPVRLVQVDAGSAAAQAGGDPASAAAREVAQQLAAEPFDHAGEWPQRVALVLVEQRVRQVVVVFSHTTVDLLATELVLQELRLLLLSGAISTPPRPQSVDIAHREQGTDLRRTQRAITYWCDRYAQLPREVFPSRGPALAPRFWRAVLRSAAAETATGLLAARHQVSSATVLVAATAAMISAWSGTGVCGIHTMSSNRALPGYQHAIAKLNQVGLLVLDLRDRPSFADLLPRVRRVALSAYRHAHYDPVRMDQELAAAGHTYPDDVNPHCFLNDIRQATDAKASGEATGEAEVRAAMRQSSLSWAERLDRYTWRARIEIFDMPAAMGIALTADTGHLPPDAIERFLHDLEALLVNAAFHDLPWPWTPVP